MEGASRPGADAPSSGPVDAPAPRERAEWVSRVAPFLLIWCFYLGVGLALASTTALREMDLLFNADVPRVIRDMTWAEGNHYRTKVHPLFVLFLNPPGRLLTLLTHSPVLSALLLSSFAGALCILLARRFFEVAGLRPIHSALYAAILGASTTHLLFGPVPETFVFAAASLVLLCLLAVHRPGSLDHFIPAGVFALGMVTTNFVPSVILFGVSAAQGRLSRPFLKNLSVFVFRVLLWSVYLSLLQRAIYPSSIPFLLPQAYQEETRYLGPLGQPGAMWQRLTSLLDHFFMFNLVAPVPHVWRTATRASPWVSFDISAVRTSDPLGLAASIVWLGLLLWSLYCFLLCRRERRPIQNGLIACLLFNFLLHLIYGNDLFVYSADWTFFVVAGVALSLQVRGQNSAAARCQTILLGSFLILELLNNGRFLGRLLQIYA